MKKWLWMLWVLIAGSACMAESVSVKDCGAKGDGITDDTQAIRKALAGANTIYFPAGVYVLSDGLDLPPSAIIRGDGSPTLGTFPMRDDDKRFLEPGKLNQLPGTTLLFKGSGSRSLTTGRPDLFSVMRYAVKTPAGLPYSISDMAIVLDVQVKDAKGKTTSPDNDGSADYDAGLLVDDSPGGSVRNVAVFGYWNKAGLCVVSRGEGSNPDYNTFWNCSFSGEHGVALIGSGTASGPGLSGSQFYGCNLFAADHHKRGTYWGTAALYIDGQTGTDNCINGHYFYGGCIRTYLNEAVKLDHAANVAFNGVVFEVPSWDGGGIEPERVNQSGRVVATGNTGDLSFISCRHHSLGFQQLSESLTNGRLFVVKDHMGTTATYSDGHAIRMMSVPGLDPVLQFTDDVNSSVSGWTIRMDTSDGNNLKFRYNNVPRSTITTE